MANLSYPWLASSWHELQRAIAQLPHAILLHSTKGLGVTQLAKQLAQTLLCLQFKQANPCGTCRACDLFQTQHHPDFWFLGGDEELIKIDSVRELQRKFQETTSIGTNKVVIIETMERLNLPAANALLKMLEEPPGNMFFIGISYDLSLLLPTIRSRCMLFNVKLSDESKAIDWLIQQNCDPNIAAFALKFCDNSPLQARDFCQQQQIDIVHTLLRDWLTLLSESSTKLNILSISQQWQTYSMAILIDFLLQILHAALCYHIQQPSILDEYSEFHSLAAQLQLDNIYTLVDYLSHAKSQLQTQIKLNHTYWVDALIAKLYMRGTL